MTDREIYPNAPLRFVAFEARFPHVPPFGLAVPPEPLRKALQARFPRSEPANVQSVEIGPGAIRQGAEMRHRFLSRDRTIALTLGAQSLSVETANYHRFEDFRESIAEAVDAVEALAEVSGLLRVGLRYVDELRVPVAISALAEWAAYVDGSLIGPVGLAPGSPVQSFGAIETQIAERQGLAMRYGSLPHGRLVDPNGPLRSPHNDPDDEPFFFIDIDSYWTAPEDDMPEFVTQAILGICNDLHSPTRTMFESSITEKLRNDVLRTQGE